MHRETKNEMTVIETISYPNNFSDLIRITNSINSKCDNVEFKRILKMNNYFIKIFYIILSNID